MANEERALARFTSEAGVALVDAAADLERFSIGPELLANLRRINDGLAYHRENWATTKGRLMGLRITFVTDRDDPVLSTQRRYAVGRQMVLDVSNRFCSIDFPLTRIKKISH